MIFACVPVMRPVREELVTGRGEIRANSCHRYMELISTPPACSISQHAMALSSPVDTHVAYICIQPVKTDGPFTGSESARVRCEREMEY